MKITKIDYADTGAFSSLITDYLAQDYQLQDFYDRFPTVENFKEQIAAKAPFPQEKREVLHQELSRQYASLDLHPEVKRNLELLWQPNTFTVTTGHQLNIFTGPLYFIYKIITAINTCRELKAAYPDYNFVPVYWMATEDHDFEEISSFTLFGKRYEWETEQKGAVGRFSTEGLEQVLEALPEQYPVFEEAYRTHRTLAEATRSFTHALFGEYGLVSIDGDSAVLKRLLIPVIRKDLLEQLSHQKVEETSERLSQVYKPQVQSREINLFYLDDQLRERIVLQGDRYQVLNTKLSFSRKEIEQEVDRSPEKFSPNVILRPLYQEMILPNLAYVGGGAEVAYWFQLKGLFEAYEVPFPILMLRNSALYIPKSQASRLHKLDLQPTDMFQDLPALRKQMAGVLNQEEVVLDQQRQAIEAVFGELEKLAAAIDPTLTKSVAAEGQKTQNALGLLEKKINKAAENKHEQVYQQLTNVKEKLFPGGTLQERTDNLLTYQTNHPDFIRELAEAFDPFDGKFTILEEE
jgi:bacillithiol synthase